MVTLEVWYDQEPENDFGPGDPPILIRTEAELNDFIDRVLDETKDHEAPAMIQAVNADDPRSAVLQVGLGQTKGFIGYGAADGGWTHGEGDPDERVEYIYMGNVSEVRASVEVSIDGVRQGLVEFLGTGRKPSVIP
ncbi:Imm1 family immunity protein [Actinokineospora sp. HUAS TT18]|uniref:Imm1 family immunity protein n=1 Tax=Actinokineospora sp. HUAS TT18 TaxID=3447451 RepID=UPI003F521663